MGTQLSKVDYSSITNIETINNIKSKKNNYKITYENGKQQKLSLNDNQDMKFNLRYKYAKMINPIKLIKYSDIKNIVNNTNPKITISKSLTNEDSIILLKLVFNDGSQINKNYNYLEYTVFMGYLKLLKPEIYTELNKIINKLLH